MINNIQFIPPKTDNAQPRKGGTLSIISLCLALLPYLVFLITYLETKGDFSNPMWWVTGIFLWIIGPLALIASLILAAKGWESEYRVCSYISVAIAIIPIVLGLLISLLNS